jgi:hypothetical protein
VLFEQRQLNRKCRFSLPIKPDEAHNGAESRHPSRSNAGTPAE